MEVNRAFLSLLMSLLLLEIALAIDPFDPPNDAALTNDQPLLSWTDYPGSFSHYALELSSSSTFTTVQRHETDTTYYQIQQPLTQNIWYWRVKVINQTNQTIETSITSSFEIVTAHDYMVTPDLSRYRQNKRVDFLIDAPLGSAVDLAITRSGFSLPFTTANLQTTSFSTFLEAGTYNLAADFNYKGIESTYQTAFTLKETDVYHHLRFNITDEDHKPLKNVNIELSGEEDYEEQTNSKGIAEFDVLEDTYEVSITKDQYQNDSFKESYKKDKNITITLFPLEEKTVTETPQVLAASAKPEIKIIRPEYRESVDSRAFAVTFTISKTTGVKGCDLLIRNGNQQGWVVAGFTNDIHAENDITVMKSEDGENSLKVRCSVNSEVIESAPRTVIVKTKPTHYQPVTEFIELIDDVHYTNIDHVLFRTIGAGTQLSEAKTALLEMETAYKGLDDDEQEAYARTIDDTLEEYKVDLLTSFKIIRKEDNVITASAEGFEIQDKRLEQVQENYVLREKIAVAELTTFEGVTTYLTSISYSVQELVDSGGQITLIGNFPSVFYQRIGIPDIVDELGQDAGSISEDTIRVTMAPGDTVSLLFDGDVMSALPAERQLMVEPSTLPPEPEKEGITGRVVSAIESTGLPSSMILTWVAIIIVIALAFANPVYNVRDYQTDRRTRAVTEDIHMIMDHFQQRRHQVAFSHYPRLNKTYAKLPPKTQDELSFAMNHLNLELETYPLRQAVAQANYALTHRPDALPMLTQRAIEEFQRLSPQAQEAVLPLLHKMQEMLN